MIDRILYMQCDLSSVPLECSTAVLIFFPATVTPTSGHYHVPYRRQGETRVGWHGETYCLVAGYRCYGDAPLATPAKVEEEKPVPRRALKRRHPVEELNEDLGCSSPKIQRLEHGGWRLTPLKLAG
ncbi:DPEP2 neighbor protein-like [Eptesicus fuscus]|uniref:DPEP2 neighbor protein-like n=1 Tax=Eptesicus fuscus TaxID=29078 RepID=UPI002403F797|nr:DPEP2 neighbor protein-like [Eptesicus fuscus]